MFFKIQKYKYVDGTSWQIKFFNIPFLQYIKSNKNKISLKIPFLRKNKSLSLMFYLKYNSQNFHSIWCLHKWIETINYFGGTYLIICDNPALESKIIKHTIWEDTNKKFIKSDRTTFKNNIKNICDNSWINAGYSHLTTFSHAKKNNINEFWNIDVDDTTFFDSPKNIANALRQVMEYAKTNDIDVFSYDMHATRFNNKHWSFGITYTRNVSKIFNIMKNTKSKKWQENYSGLQKLFGDYNLDWYFTYLRDNKIINAKTFDINNLYFAHWGFATPTALTRLVQVEYDNNLHFPLATSLCNIEYMQKIPISDDIVVFETGVKKEESLKNLSDMLSSYELRIKNSTSSNE